MKDCNRFSKDRLILQKLNNVFLIETYIKIQDQTFFLNL